MDCTNMKKELKDLILRSLSANHFSESCKDGITTLNHY